MKIDLIDNVSNTPDLTCFVPNSARALAKINGSNPDPTRLDQLAQYHCTVGLVYSTGLVNDTQLLTRTGLPVLVTLQDNDIYINTTKITSRDNLVANGVFHVIDE